MSWNNFSETSAAAFGHFGTNKEFSDVTLASGDGQQVEAHRVVLSVCSPVLRDILIKIPHNHPLIYMKGVNMEDLQLILRFLYFGEVVIVQKDFQKFMECADELKIAGLAANFDKEGLEENKKEINETNQEVMKREGSSISKTPESENQVEEKDEERESATAEDFQNPGSQSESKGGEPLLPSHFDFGGGEREEHSFVADTEATEDHMMVDSKVKMEQDSSFVPARGHKRCRRSGVRGGTSRGRGRGRPKKTEASQITKMTFHNKKQLFESDESD